MVIARIELACAAINMAEVQIGPQPYGAADGRPEIAEREILAPPSSIPYPLGKEVPCLADQGSIALEIVILALGIALDERFDHGPVDAEKPGRGTCRGYPAL